MAEANEAFGRLRDLLPADRREILGLKVEGLTSREIGDRLGLSERTVRRALKDLRRRARARMRRRTDPMNSIALGRTWDEASSPEVVELAHRFGMGLAPRSGPSTRPARIPPRSARRPPRHPPGPAPPDMALRREAGESVRVEWYQCQYPSLDDEALVALIYEEFCLREEAGDFPDPDGYEARFPALAGRLREILKIHGFVAECPSTAPHPHAPEHGPDYPEAGQTIAGFRLIEELGRGSFARVFLPGGRSAWPTGRSCSRSLASVPASPRHWRGSGVPTSSRSTPTAPIRRGAPSALHALFRPAAWPGSWPSRPLARSRSGANSSEALDGLHSAANAAFGRTECLVPPHSP